MTDGTGPDNSAEFTERLFRMVAALALGLSTISGGYTISTTDDRIRKAEVQIELRIRDVQIENLIRQLNDVKKDVERIDRAGPAIGNAYLLQKTDELEKRVRELERGD